MTTIPTSKACSPTIRIFVDATVGILEMVIAAGRAVIETDYRVKGEVWRVHKSDADPYPSSPHAHCIAGTKRFVGLTLHLGTAELFDGRKARAVD